MAHLKVCTKCSARPFDEGWYGEHRMYLMWFPFMNWLNLVEVNRGPLSVSNCSGNLNCENGAKGFNVVLGSGV